jgi:hypothetical protein
LVLRAIRDAPFGLALLSLRVPRRRAGTFEPLDFALVLLAFAASDAEHLKDFYAQIPHVASALAALWDRDRLPSRSALSRFLAAVTPAHVDTLGQWLLDDLLANGAQGAALGGLYDRDGARSLLFDDDGTYHGARQRELAQEADRPPPRRRAATLCAKGYYGGSRRADVTRTRTVLRQAHTQEWLGTWSAPGNGQPFAQLEKAATVLVRYLTAKGLSPSQGVLRLDGLYGYARVAATVVRAGLGYLLRCVDYRLLARDEVQQVLTTTTPVLVQLPDSPVQREAWQVLNLSWVAAKDAKDAVVTRLLVTRRPAQGPGKPRVGKRMGKHVYELFATDRSPTGWTIEDVVQMYFARGGFERTLAEEDRERELDRTRSFTDAGQSFWTVLGQLVANVRLRLGTALQGTVLRRTLWASATPATLEADSAPRQLAAGAPADATDANPAAPAAPAAPVAPVAPVAPAEPAEPAEPAGTPDVSQATPPAPLTAPIDPQPAEALRPTPPAEAPTRGRLAAARGRSQGRYGGEDFQWTAQGALQCPAGALLHRGEVRRERRQLRVVYRASAKDCGTCAQWTACRGRPTHRRGARSVTVLEPLLARGRPRPSAAPTHAPPAAPESPARRALGPPPSREGSPARDRTATGRPPRVGVGAVWWVDTAASAARALLREQLQGQQVTIEPSPVLEVRRATPFTRDQRAHRRKTWKERYATNQRAPGSGLRIRLHGVPALLSRFLGILPASDAAA